MKKALAEAGGAFSVLMVNDAICRAAGGGG